ncbi:MAG: HDIG domain-containing protein [Clostridiales bacterium]|nr:HDIG domain-containing protein [Clostridiales bacterium]
MLRRKSDKAFDGKELLQQLSIWFHGASTRCLLLLILGGLVLFLLFSAVCMSQRYSLQAGDTVTETIIASKDVEDTVTTEQRRLAAEQSVEAVYHIDEGINSSILSKLGSIFTELAKVQEYGMMLIAEKNPSVSSAYVSFTDAEVKEAQAMVTLLKLSPYQTRLLLRTESENFNTMCYEVQYAVESALGSTITLKNESTAINSIVEHCQYRVEIVLISQIVRPILNECIEANVIADVEATNMRRQEARAQVSPVIYQQGSIILSEGDKVGQNHLRMLEELGMLDTAGYDFSILGGAFLLIIGAMIMLWLLLKLYSPAILTDMRSMLVILLVMIITQALSVICVKLINVYLSPLALSAILLTGLLGSRVGIAGGLTMTVIVSGLSAAAGSDYSIEMIYLLLTGVVSSVVSAQFLSGKPQRVRAVICGAIVGATNLLLILAVGLMTAADLHNTVGSAIWSMAGGLLSGLIAVGFQPVFEAAFNLATPSKLLELANPNQPLLRRLLMEAPGTYHHSIVVANLSEAAADKIGANSLLARTGAYFHDVGKLKRPLYFKENQRGDNPHDRTDAYVSAAIVTSHTRDGLQLAQKYHLPPEVQRIIAEHHGDTPVMYFYHKALQQADGKPVDVKDFRYGGSRPGTKESAIVMLADTIEAAVRSMSDPTPQAIQRFIERLVRGKIEDGQLSNSPLSLHDIDGICEAFSKVLSGVFHERIEYPTVQMNNGEAVTPPAAQPAQPAQEQGSESDTDTMPEPYAAPMPDDLVPAEGADKAAQEGASAK